MFRPLKYKVALSAFSLLSISFLFSVVVIFTPSRSFGLKGPWISLAAKGNHFSLDDFEYIQPGPPSRWSSLGAGLGFDPTRRLTMSVNYDVILANTNAVVEMYAYVLTAELEYLHPLSKTFSLGGGVGYGSIRLSGSSPDYYFTFEYPGRPFFADGVKGEDSVFQCFSTARWYWSKSGALFMKIGYRSALVDELKSNSGWRLTTSEGHPAEADYSGWFLGLGVRLYPFDQDKVAR